ncbi:DUF2500 family protein [Blastopirellula retiformator]|uniref:Zinc-ribbon domain-containing protein n=1 Tax=Blastopirellula retiformator TaxID=2527970 RepID=A0A5C5VMT8_9BACT|nr:DUF2500 family protein [Blastopirellula retiformator]TWT39343.1 hypothetical protein Enr8_10420 [Blastopirellula retiformator]
MNCKSCGAHAPADARFCHYCGGQIESPSPQSPSRADIFARIKASPQYRESQSPERLGKLPTPSAAPKALFTVFSYLVAGKLALAVIAPVGFLLFVIFFFVAGGARSPQSFFLIAFVLALFLLAVMVVVGVGMSLLVKKLGGHVFSGVFKKQEELENASIEVQPAIVVAKRTHVWGGIGDSSAKTNYYATFELEDGSRHEFALWYGTMYGRIAEEDAGVLFSRVDYAADFDLVTL